MHHRVSESFCPATELERIRRSNAVYSRALGSFETFVGYFYCTLGGGGGGGCGALNVGSTVTFHLFGQQDLRLRYEREVLCNEIAWRLAVLNPKFAGKPHRLQRVLDAYRDRFCQVPLSVPITETAKAATEEKTNRMGSRGDKDENSLPISAAA